MEKLGESGRRKYEKVSEVEGEITAAQAEEFFRENISNYDEMVQKVIADFKAEMMKVDK